VAKLADGKDSWWKVLIPLGLIRRATVSQHKSAFSNLEAKHKNARPKSDDYETDSRKVRDRRKADRKEQMDKDTLCMETQSRLEALDGRWLKWRRKMHRMVTFLHRSRTTASPRRIMLELRISEESAMPRDPRQ
jgi:hypothetical protein